MTGMGHLRLWCTQSLRTAAFPLIASVPEERRRRREWAISRHAQTGIAIRLMMCKLQRRIAFAAACSDAGLIRQLATTLVPAAPRRQGRRYPVEPVRSTIRA